METTANQPGRLPGDEHNRLAYTLLLASTLHLVVILGVGFVPEERSANKPQTQNIKVILVPEQEKKTEKPEQADLLAQADNQGGGQTENKEAEAIPHPLPEPELAKHKTPPASDAAPPLPPPAPRPAPVEQPPQAEKPTAQPSKPKIVASSSAPKAKQARQQNKPDKRKSEAAPKPGKQAAAPPRPRVSAAQLLASRGNEIARLTTELERKSAAYASRTKRKAISASTTEYKYATYMESWRRKVENIGNLNYPDEARRKKLYGNLLLHVAVRADGSVERIRVLKSSGHKLLHDAAIRIVRLAAPYAPFPPDIRKEVDVLDITRTWQFLNSNRLGWK